MELVKEPLHRNGPLPRALFDASHGQTNWAQTGFPSRELHTNFAGLTELLCHRGWHCRSTGQDSFQSYLATSQLLILPPPTGRYDARKECWRRERPSLFTREELRAVLGFLHAGGRLLAFAYRFGDAFTQTNLGDLFMPLGGQLNDDVVIDLRALRQTHPLPLHFSTPAELLSPTWARGGVARVSWRPAAAFTLLPGATAWPLALNRSYSVATTKYTKYTKENRSQVGGRTRITCLKFQSPFSAPLPASGSSVGTFLFVCFVCFVVLPSAWIRLSAGGACLSFDRTLRRICWTSRPLAVAGQHGPGRFALFGGPHVFESSPLGLLAQPDNTRFRHNILDWLLQGAVGAGGPGLSLATPPTNTGHDWTGVEARGEGARTIAAMERLLRQTGVFKALSRAKWMP